MSVVVLMKLDKKEYQPIVQQKNIPESFYSALYIHLLPNCLLSNCSMQYLCWAQIFQHFQIHHSTPNMCQLKLLKQQKVRSIKIWYKYMYILVQVYSMGCILSSFLFNLYAERIMRNTEMEEAKEGVKIAGKTLNNLRYADDTTLMAGKKWIKLIRRLKRESEKAGLYFNIKKTKI